VHRGRYHPPAVALQSMPPLDSVCGLGPSNYASIILGEDDEAGRLFLDKDEELGVGEPGGRVLPVYGLGFRV
jgi:hypothetical protein